MANSLGREILVGETVVMAKGGLNVDETMFLVEMGVGMKPDTTGSMISGVWLGTRRSDFISAMHIDRLETEKAHAKATVEAADKIHDLLTTIETMQQYQQGLQDRFQKAQRIAHDAIPSLEYSLQMLLIAGNSKNVESKEFLSDLIARCREALDWEI